jgi:hypothetical protein
LVFAPRGNFASAAATPTTVTASSFSPAADPDVHGFFFFKGRIPAAFRNIDHLNLDIPGGTGTPPYYGQIRLKAPAGTDYKLLNPTLDGKHLIFKTKTVRGIRYEFDGMLTRTNFDEPQPESNEIVLTGTLKKLRSGRVIATSRVRCTWYLGD